MPRLPVGDFIPDEVYELCDLTPAELAAVAILKKRGPPPRPPSGPYRGHAIDKSGDYGVLLHGDELSSEFKATLESSLKSSLGLLSIKDRPPALGPKPPALGPKPPVAGSRYQTTGSPRPKPPITSPKPVRELKPPPRRKHLEKKV